ncbi:hypothetical protein [Burkholderia contaminans]|uniref:hypothetical protein n=1 Tax=Burkholderia contaminans TaxID=488447 RepID=UPI001CF46837|nr:MULTISPECIES: hypothetical protein [Burkholderia]MCA7884761.1 hypothetical protein [Burkholderia contaminans]
MRARRGIGRASQKQRRETIRRERVDHLPHVGFLPGHVAAPWVAAGKMRRLLASKLSHTVAFQLATPRNCDGSEALEAFTAALAEQFGGLDGVADR